MVEINYWVGFLVESGDSLEGAGGSGVSLSNAIGRRSISEGGTADWDSIVSKRLSGPLSKSLGRSGNKGGGVSGVGSNTKTISIGVWSIGSISIVSSISFWFSISGPLAIVSVWVSISISSSVSIGIWGISISVVGISLWFSISRPLSITSIACGLAVWGAHTWPVGVGVVEGGGGEVAIAGLSLGSNADSDSSSNL